MAKIFSWIAIAVLLVLIGGVLMVAINVLFDIFTAAIIVLTAVLVVFGIIFGLIIALKNTMVVYHHIYKSK